MLIPNDLKKWLKMRMPNCVHSSAILSYIVALEEDVGSKIAEIARLENRIRQLESAQPKWISVEDELPPVGEKVLVCANNVRLMAFIDCEDVWHRDTITYRLPGEVTHWMPLPSTEGIE